MYSNDKIFLTTPIPSTGKQPLLGDRSLSNLRVVSQKSDYCNKCHNKKFTSKKRKSCQNVTVQVHPAISVTPETSTNSLCNVSTADLDIKYENVSSIFKISIY